MHDTGYLGLVHWDDPEGWYRERGGRWVQDGEHMDSFRYLAKLIQFVKFKNKIKLKKNKRLYSSEQKDRQYTSLFFPLLKMKNKSK